MLRNARSNAARQYAHLAVAPLAGSLGAEIGGVDLNDPMPAALAEIRQAAGDHLVLFFRDQALDPDGLEAFARRIGPAGEDPFVRGLDSHPSIIRVVREADDAQPVVFGASWHSDWSFRAEPPSFTLLYGHDVPAFGGDTLFVNMYLAYERLSEEMRRICDGLTALHSAARGYGPKAAKAGYFEHMDIVYSEDAHAVQAHPLVRSHPETGRRALFVNPGYTVAIKGMRADESRAILDILFKAAIEPAHVCRFRWQPGSLAMWDNRCTMHQAIGDYAGARREMYRTTIAGDAPV